TAMRYETAMAVVGASFECLRLDRLGRRSARPPVRRGSLGPIRCLRFGDLRRKLLNYFQLPRSGRKFFCVQASSPPIRSPNGAGHGGMMTEARFRVSRIVAKNRDVASFRRFR